MSSRCSIRLGIAVLGVASIAGLARVAPAQPVTADTATPAARAGVDAFNQALDDATRRMDTAAALALWEDDGVSLLPGTPPLVGKPAIRAFFDGVTAQYPGARMATFTLACTGLDVTGAWASEWCTAHQVLTLASGTLVDGRGHLLLVLHRGADGRWRLRREMWTPAPAAAPR